MSEETFEEQFPSLLANHLVIESVKGKVNLLPDGSNEEDFREYCLTPKELKCWNYFTIQKHCLDKQKVKEAIEKLVESKWTKDLIYTELGLDGE